MTFVAILSIIYGQVAIFKIFRLDSLLFGCFSFRMALRRSFATFTPISVNQVLELGSTQGKKKPTEVSSFFPRRLPASSLLHLLTLSMAGRTSTTSPRTIKACNGTDKCLIKRVRSGVGSECRPVVVLLYFATT